MIATILITEHPERIKGDFEIPLLTVEIARTVIARAASGFASPTILVVRGLDTASEEVQNTFLKILEEHPDSVSFLFPVLSDTAILPTIRSRCTVTYETAPKNTSPPSAYDWATILPAIQSKKILPSVALKITNGKKEVFVAALNDYLHYSRQNNSSISPHTISRCIEALRLITNNNVDPELAFNTAFL